VTGTISTTITSTYNLIVQYTTVLDTGKVTVIAGPAISGTYVSSGFGWTVTNAGTLLDSAAGQNGINLSGVGDHLTNNTGGVISAAGKAIYFANGAAQLVNRGTIATTDSLALGVDMHSGGSAINAASASITGGLVGLEITGAAGTVVNDGNIANINTAGSGVLLLLGSVTNAASASIKGGDVGVSFGFGTEPGAFAGTVVNNGSIAGGLNGVSMYFGGSVTNAASASITGSLQGVVISNGIGTLVNSLNGAGTVFNAGSIGASASGGWGVRLISGGSATNAASGVITGGDGVYIRFGVGTLVNYGSVAATGIIGEGAYLASGGAVTNAAAASITGTSEGVRIIGGAARVLNAGSIAGTGTNAQGIYLKGSGAVTNAASASITGVYGGVEVASGTVTLINDGSIGSAGSNSSAVQMRAGGSLTNAASGSIAGGKYGIQIYGGAGTVFNDGRIVGTGTNGHGVNLGSGGSVTNAASGSIAGNYGGVGIYGGVGTVRNDGTIVDTNGVGVLLYAGGSVTNGTSASITGIFGVAITTIAGTIINDGNIVGTGEGFLTLGSGGSIAYAGIVLNAGGAVTNAAAASITGNGHGVYITGGAGTVVNAGAIESVGTKGRGIYLSDGGRVSNAATGTISGSGANGVYINGSVGTILNAGIIMAPTGTHSAVALIHGGYLSNAGIGTIRGALSTGVYISGAAGTVVNAGQILSGGTHSGASLEDGGRISNQAGGTIAGTPLHPSIYIAGAPGTVINQGLISYGVNLHAGGAVTNTAGGTIAAQNGNGVLLNIAATTVINTGLITGGGTANAGIRMVAGGYVDNLFGGTITSAIQDGIAVRGGIGTVLNSGDIIGQSNAVNSYDGVIFNQAAGILTNMQTGSITGAAIGVFFYKSGGTLTNFGHIGGINDGIVLEASGAITNAASAFITGGVGVGVFASPGTIINDGTITGNNDGVALNAGGTLANGGAIVGNAGTAAAFGGTGSNLLVLDPGFAFSGLVAGSNSASNMLELASSASAGSVTGLGTAFTNFGPISFDPGSQWFISGDTDGLAGTISGFAFGDTIEVTGITTTGSSYADGVLTLFETSGSVALNLPGSFATGDFLVSNVAAGADVSLACFAEGTRIRTERGAVAVESLQVGDRVVVAIGAGTQPIVWVGHRRVDCQRHPKPTQVWPICLSAGAFSPGQPTRDLWLSPDHAVFIGGVLIPIRYLVNGRTIRQVPRDKITYWHIELAEHNVLYAEGVPAESYLDTGNRGAFANRGAVTDLHADLASRVWDAHGCAPLVLSGPKMAAAKRHLHDRLIADRYWQDEEQPIRAIVV
jgi:fibronectin-binding autotransporter adhesin